MSSNPHQQYLSADNMDMLRRVLLDAGFPASRSRSDNRTENDAARFLVRQFQTGCCGQGALLSALNRHLAHAASLPGRTASPLGDGIDLAAASIAGRFRATLGTKA